MAGTISAKKSHETIEVLSVQDNEGRTYLAPITAPTDHKSEVTFPSNTTRASNIGTVAEKASDSRFLEKPRQKEEPVLVHTTRTSTVATLVASALEQEPFKKQTHTQKHSLDRSAEYKSAPKLIKPLIEAIPAHGDTSEIPGGLLGETQSTFITNQHGVGKQANQQESHSGIIAEVVGSLDLGVEPAKQSNEVVMDKYFFKSNTKREDLARKEQEAFGSGPEKDDSQADGEQHSAQCLSFIEKNPQDAPKTSLANPAALAISKTTVISKEPRELIKEEYAESTRPKTRLTEQKGNKERPDSLSLSLSSRFLNNVRAEWTITIKTNWGEGRSRPEPLGKDLPCQAIVFKPLPEAKDPNQLIHMSRPSDRYIPAIEQCVGADFKKPGHIKNNFLPPPCDTRYCYKRICGTSSPYC
ncbi:hypothetical protein H4Q26_007980 [Puccinia striiformis f. sp. tritici PST-130]|nr:hypothetical protein H4Q26_007980 [Puccinia striiformis f. sp. tritici PST-130]